MLNIPLQHAGWTLTSQPFGVVLDRTQDRTTFSQTSVNHCIARQEVCHGGRVEITTWERKKKKVIDILCSNSQEQPTSFKCLFLVTGDFCCPLKGGRGEQMEENVSLVITACVNFAEMSVETWQDWEQVWICTHSPWTWPLCVHSVSASISAMISTEDLTRNQNLSGGRLQPVMMCAMILNYIYRPGMMYCSN